MKIAKLAIVTALLLLLEAAGAEAGTAGVRFLQIGVGARACGMGEAFCAVADDASAVYWNPAGIGFIERKGIIFTHAEWLEGTTHGSILGVDPLSNIGTLGAAITYLGYGDIESTDEIGNRLGPYSACDLALVLAFSRRIATDLSVGVKAKVIRSRIEDEGGHALAGGVGVLYKMPTHGLRVGLLFENFGTGLRFLDQTTSLPMTLRSGISYALQLSQIDVTPAIDFVKEIDGDHGTNIGVEVRLMDLIAVRAGGKIGPSDDRMTAGLGVIWGFSLFQTTVDYAYADYGNLGTPHRISAGILF